jgi:hypothetical protein
MNCENPVFRDCEEETEGIAPVSKDLTKHGDKYLIQFKFNGNKTAKCCPSNIKDLFDSAPFELSIYMGAESQKHNPPTSTATIEINRELTEEEKNADVRVIWYHSGKKDCSQVGPGKKISSCTIKLADARPAIPSPSSKES